MTDKEKILSFIREEYTRTKWPYTYKQKIKKQIDGEIEKALLEMKNEGMIDFEVGIHGTLVVYEEGRKETERLSINKSLNRHTHGKHSKNPHGA